MADFRSGPLTFSAMAAIIAVFVARGVPQTNLKKEAPSSTQLAAQQGTSLAGALEAPTPVQSGAATCKQWCEPLRLSEEFFSIRPSDDSSSRVTRIAGVAKALRYDLEVLIALIPDPVDSGLTYRTDEALVAIQRGFAASGYLLDRRSLPWEGEAAKSRKYREVPGVLLFRRPGDGKHKSVLTLVLLVGETAKSGLHKISFNEALDFSQQLLNSVGRRCTRIRILGPTFSGTAESLRISLRTWIDRKDKGVTNSGAPAPPSENPQGTVVLEARPSAGGLGAMETLQLSLQLRMDRKKTVEDSAKPLWRPGFHILTGSATATGLEESFKLQFAGDVLMERVILDDDQLTRETYQFLQKRMGWNFNHVAILSESDTSYGQGVQERDFTGQRLDEESPTPRLVLRFPSHISRIRTAREKEGLRNKNSDSEELVEPSRKNLELSLSGEDQGPVDIVPQLSSLSTASEDLALANQLETLCREDIRYVGILATDIRDRLFLAEHVRSLCPDVVLFTLDNHLLNEHPRFTQSMEGSLVLTSFPLYIFTKDHPNWRNRQNVSELQHGIFLAVRQFLKGKRIGEQVRPWGVVLGKRDLWPLFVVEDRPSINLAFAGSGKVTFKWAAVGAGIGLLAIWLCAAARPVRQAGAWRWTSAAGDLPGRLVLLLGMGTLILACGVLLVFYSLPLWNPSMPPLGRWWEVLNLVALAGLYTGLVVTCARYFQKLGARVGVFAMVLWIVYAILLLVLLSRAMCDLWLLPGSEGLFYARASDLSSGLSPLVSLACLLAAVFSRSLLELKRRNLALRQALKWPLSTSPEVSEQPLATGGDRAQRLDRCLWRWKPGGLFLVALLFILLLPVPRLLQMQPVTEPAPYGWVFLALVTLGFILGVFAFNRFITVWRKLEAILELLCHTWVLQALRRSSSTIDWKPLRSFGWRLPRHKMFLLSVEQLKTLAHMEGVLEANHAMTTIPDGALDRALREILEARDYRDEIKKRRELRTYLQASTHRLQATWRTLGGADPRVDTDKELSEKERILREIEKFIALRVAAWLRYVFAHLRYSLLASMACGLFVLLGVSSYTFQPKRFLSFGIWGFLLVGSLLTLQIFIRMDRNTTLSAISGTPAGELSLDRTFFSNIVTYVGIPVLGVVLTQFPAVGNLVGDWLQPLLKLFSAS